MPDNSMYVRCLAVITSCRHSHHLRTARSYIKLVADSGLIDTAAFNSLQRRIDIQRTQMFGGSAA